MLCAFAVGKKRKARPELWTRNAVQAKKARGLPHYTYSGKLVEGRTAAEFDCRCCCSEKFSDVEKRVILNAFNALANHESQNRYLAMCTVPDEATKRRTTRQVAEKRRNFSYFVEIYGDNSTERIKVCKTAFLALHGIKASRLRRKVQCDRSDLRDKRGTSANSRRLLDPYPRRMMRIHIRSFQARESHYSRSKNCRRRYLDSSLSVAVMHRMFTTLHPSLAGVVSYETYRREVNTRFNISFGFPRSDICDQCELLDAKSKAESAAGHLQKQRAVETQRSVHLAKADVFYTQLREIPANSNANSLVLAIDYEKNLPLPVTGVGPEYYKRQLWLHNFCIKDLVSGESTMYLYSETFAKKGPNETISCLEDYLKNVAGAELKELHIFLDNCFAQNKNRYLWAFLNTTVLTGRFRSVHIYYPIPGHSRLPCDKDFGLIEKRRKRMDRVAVPSEWVSLIKSVRVQNPFRVRYVNHPLTDDLLDDGTPIVTVKDYKTPLDRLLAASVNGLKSVRGVVFRPASIRSRMTMAGDADTDVKLLKRGAKWHSVVDAVQNATEAYDDYVSIKAAKVDDVNYLIQRVYLPAQVTFYTSMRKRTRQPSRL